MFSRTRPISNRSCKPVQQYKDEIEDLAQQLQGQQEFVTDTEGQEELVTDTVGGGAMNIWNWQLRIEEVTKTDRATR